MWYIYVCMYGLLVVYAFKKVWEMIKVTIHFTKIGGCTEIHLYYSMQHLKLIKESLNQGDCC